MQQKFLPVRGQIQFNWLLIDWPVPIYQGLCKTNHAKMLSWNRQRITRIKEGQEWNTLRLITTNSAKQGKYHKFTSQHPQPSIICMTYLNFSIHLIFDDFNRQFLMFLLKWIRYTCTNKRLFTKKRGTHIMLWSSIKIQPMDS